MLRKDISEAGRSVEAKQSINQKIKNALLAANKKVSVAEAAEAVLQEQMQRQTIQLQTALADATAADRDAARARQTVQDQLQHTQQQLQLTQQQLEHTQQQLEHTQQQQTDSTLVQSESAKQRSHALEQRQVEELLVAQTQLSAAQAVSVELELWVANTQQEASQIAHELQVAQAEIARLRRQLNTNGLAFGLEGGNQPMHVASRPMHRLPDGPNTLRSVDPNVPIKSSVADIKAHSSAQYAQSTASEVMSPEADSLERELSWWRQNTIALPLINQFDHTLSVLKDMSQARE